LSLYLLVILGVLSGLAWTFTWRQWERVSRWWYQVGDKKFLKRPNLDVGLLYVLFIGNTLVLAVLVHQRVAATGRLSADAESMSAWLSLAVTLVLGLGAMAVWFGLGRWLYGTGWSQWGLGPIIDGKLVSTLRASFLGFLLLVPAVLIVHACLGLVIEYRHDTLDRFLVLRQASRWDLLAVVFIFTAVWTPIVEELAFRVILQGFVEQLFRYRRQRLRWLLGPLQSGPAETLGLAAVAQTAGQEPPGPRERAGLTSLAFWAPIVISSLLFALAHAGQGAAPISLYLLAMGLGFLYKTTGNVVLCILIHAYLNGLTLTHSLWF